MHTFDVILRSIGVKELRPVITSNQYDFIVTDVELPQPLRATTGRSPLLHTKRHGSGPFNSPKWAIPGYRNSYPTAEIVGIVPWARVKVATKRSDRVRFWICMTLKCTQLRLVVVVVVNLTVDVDESFCVYENKRGSGVVIEP